MKTPLKKLELLQKEFQEWLKKAKENIEKNDIEKDLIEKKLIEIANKNDYKFISRLDDAGSDHFF